MRNNFSTIAHILLILIIGGIGVQTVTSCSSDDGGGGGDGVVACPDAVTGNGTVTCGGQTYKTVEIGSQTWMAENLNYNASGSGPVQSVCYAKQEIYCEKYGRLYNWGAAMKVCPSGWHLPSDAEWNVLMKYVNPSCSSSSYSCEDAGTKLKAASGWNYYNGDLDIGTDDYGFSALPGGSYSGTPFDSPEYTGYFDGRFEGAGTLGCWWSSSVHDSYVSTWSIFSFNGNVHNNYAEKNWFSSVRCLKN